MLNNVVLMGRLGGEPELRHTQGNTPVCSFTLAVQRPKYNGNDPVTDWIDIVAWNKTAEFVAKWFHKGMLVAVEGRLQVRNWEDKSGQKRKAVEVIAHQAHFAEARRESRDMGPDEDEWREINGDDGELPF